MNSILKQIFQNIDPKQKGFKKKLMSFAFFLFISTAFWFLNALNEKYNETISYPVTYRNFPKDKTQILDLPKNLSLNVKATGYGLLNYYLSANITPLLVNFESKNTKNKGHIEYILSHDLVFNHRVKLLKDFDIQEISPDTIKFSFDKISYKKVPVRVNLKYTISDGYILKDPIKAYPDSVTISGPERSLRNITFVQTGTLDVGMVKETLKRNVALKKLEGLEFSDYRANILLPIEQATENIVEIPISLDIKQQTNRLKLIPNVVKVSYKVGLSRYKDITPDFFKAFVVLNDDDDNSSVLNVSLEQASDIAFDVEYTPHFVEYIHSEDD